MAIKSITGEELQDKLLAEFFDSRYFGDQHWFAARAEIEALNARIFELEAQVATHGHSLDRDWSQDANKLNGKAEKGREVKPTS